MKAAMLYTGACFLFGSGDTGSGEDSTLILDEADDILLSTYLDNSMILVEMFLSHWSKDDELEKV